MLLRRPLPVPGPLPARPARHRRTDDPQVLLAVALAAVILPPAHLARVLVQVLPADPVMRADLRSAQA